MKEKIESELDDLIQRVRELGKEGQRLARVAVRQYSVEVECIIRGQIRDTMRIERCLDGMLDFCFYDEMLSLYKKLCRYYFDFSSDAAVSYVNAYRELWDE